MKKLYMSLIALTAMSVATIHAQTLISDSFSLDTQFSNFTTQSNVAADGMAWSDNNGVGGVSGRIDVITTGFLSHTNAVFYTGAGSDITKNFTDTFTATIFFRTGASITQKVSQASVGFLRSGGSTFRTDVGGYAFWGQLRTDGAGNYLRLLQTNGQVGSNSSTFTLLPNNWYAVRASITLSADNVASSMSVSIYNVGPTGTAPFGSPLASTSASNVSLPNGGFTGNLLAGFGGGNFEGSNIIAFDNFRVSLNEDDVSPAGNRLILEKTTDLTVWQGVAITPSMLTQEGAIAISEEGKEREFYRLRITPDTGN